MMDNQWCHSQLVRRALIYPFRLDPSRLVTQWKVASRSRLFSSTITCDITTLNHEHLACPIVPLQTNWLSLWQYCPETTIALRQDIWASGFAPVTAHPPHSLDIITRNWTASSASLDSRPLDAIMQQVDQPHWYSYQPQVQMEMTDLALSQNLMTRTLSLTHPANKVIINTSRCSIEWWCFPNSNRISWRASCPAWQQTNSSQHKIHFLRSWQIKRDEGSSSISELSSRTFAMYANC
jgi:hypothetical protein